MSQFLKLMLMWSLSPVGTILNTGLLAVAMILGGVDSHRPLFWLALAIFLAVSAYFDVSAYLVQRRKGLSSYEVAEAVYERLWHPGRREES